MGPSMSRVDWRRPAERGGEVNAVGSVCGASGTVEKSNSAATSHVAFCVVILPPALSRSRPSRFRQLCLGWYLVPAGVPTSRSLRVDLWESPGVSLGVRSLTRRVRDDCGVAGGKTLDVIGELFFGNKIWAYQKRMDA